MVNRDYSDTTNGTPFNKNGDTLFNEELFRNFRFNHWINQRIDNLLKRANCFGGEEWIFHQKTRSHCK